MLTTSDLTVIIHLRKNARKKITEISREMKIPVTTLYDKIRAQEKKGIFKKHVAVLDFNKLGYYTRAVLAITVGVEKREQLKHYLMHHHNVNFLYRVDAGHDFVFEVIFEDPDKLQQFIDQTELMFAPYQMKTYNILQELKTEDFLSCVPLSSQG
jgi:DNA-binding Lrp family transcriptional regulator